MALGSVDKKNPLGSDLWSDAADASRSQTQC